MATTRHDGRHGSDNNRDGRREPLTDAERARRYRARRRGENVPLGQPGRPPETETLSHAEAAQRAAYAMYAEIGWLQPAQVESFGWVLDVLADQIVRLRPDWKRPSRKPLKRDGDNPRGE